MVDREVIINNLLYTAMLGLIVAILLIYDYAGVTVVKATLITIVFMAATAVVTRWYYGGGATTIHNMASDFLASEFSAPEVELVAESLPEPTTQFGLFNPDGSMIVWR